MFEAVSCQHFSHGRMSALCFVVLIWYAISGQQHQQYSPYSYSAVKCKNYVMISPVPMTCLTELSWNTNSVTPVSGSFPWPLKSPSYSISCWPCCGFSVHGALPLKLVTNPLLLVIDLICRKLDPRLMSACHLSLLSRLFQAKDWWEAEAPSDLQIYEQKEKMSLDIKQLQVLFHFPGDAHGFDWHHRVLLKKLGGGKWIVLDPDLAIGRADLNTQAHVVLERNAPFPAAQALATYAFDPLSKQQLDGCMRRAEAMAMVFDDQDVVELDAFNWVVADVHHPSFGAQLSDAEMLNANIGFAKGFTEVNGEEVFVEKIKISDLDDWKKQRMGDEGDLRLLGNHRDSSGARHLPLSFAVGLMRESTFDDWKYMGPRAAKEYVTAVRDGPGDLTSYHHQWAKRSGVNEYSSVAHDHKVLTETLRAAIMVDQIDISNLQSFELIVRRLIQHEIAVSRNPQHPDYSGLDVVMQAPTKASGQASVAAFTEYITGQMKDQANILKQSRLWKEEQTHAHKRDGGGHGGGAGGGRGGGGDGGGGGAASPKKKGKKKPSGAGSADAGGAK